MPGKVRTLPKHATPEERDVIQGIYLRLEALERDTASPVEWTPLALAAGFVNLGGGSATAAYFQDGRRVWVKGALYCAAGGAYGTPIATFGAGLRPKQTQRFAVAGHIGTYQNVSLGPSGVLINEVVIPNFGVIDISFSFLAEQ